MSEELRRRKVDCSLEVIGRFGNEGINYDGLETVLVSEGLEFW